MNNKTNTNITYEVVRKMRGDWGAIKPTTKVIPNKKKNYEYNEDIKKRLEIYDDFDWEYDDYDYDY